MAEDWQNAGFGLYVHWPFCEAKCPYCDFNSHVARDIDQFAWATAYLKELDRVAAELPDRVLNTIFFGGGTPSLMSPDTVAAIISAAGRHWRLANDLEVTLEANPGSVETGRFAGYCDAGVNRVSLGIQALNDPDLKRLGRIHTVHEARTALDVAHRHFDRVSFDLIYARQDQTLSQWQDELKLALSLNTDHLSLYQLTIEQGTAFGDRYAAGKLRGLPQDDLSAGMFEATQDLCAAHGLPRYEVSNHARPGQESRHNLIYWRYGDYAGIGPGAHGRLTIGGQRYATDCIKNPVSWLAAVEKGLAESVRSKLSKHEQAQEYLMMGLRLSEGIDPIRYEDLGGRPLNSATIEKLGELGIIDTSNRNIIVYNQGVMLLNSVITEFLTS